MTDQPNDGGPAFPVPPIYTPEGLVCEGCGEWFDDVLCGADAPGFPRRCPMCQPQHHRGRSYRRICRSNRTMSVRIINADCRDALRQMPAGSVHCCVTSPPYFGLRDYGHAGQIGLEPTPDEFVAEMVAVFREVRRVLRPDGTVFLNLGDSYFNTSGGTTGGCSPKSTLGGGGGRYRKGSKNEAMFNGGGARRAIACDISDRAPVGSQGHGCLCGNLCDACRKAYRIGKSHTGSPLVPTLGASIPVSNRGRKGLPSDHPPTLDCAPQAARSEVANPDPVPSAAHADARPLVSPQTKMRESYPPHPEGSRLLGQPSECLVCGCSLPDCVPESSRKEECNCGTSGLVSGSDTSGMGASGSAYPHLTTTSLKPKDLIGIPWRVAFALQADGWFLRQDIIWSKPNPMPESVQDRCTKAHEYLFLLSKSSRYHFDAEAIQEAAIRPEGAGNKTHKGATAYADGDEKMRTNVGLTEIGARETRNKRSVWTVPTQPFADAHFATFPPALIEPCILAGCPAGGTVLDPFGGAGTTGLVADRHGRDAILIELNPEYAAMAGARISNDSPLFVNIEGITA